jgi:hypothetical protein
MVKYLFHLFSGCGVYFNSKSKYISTCILDTNVLESKYFILSV